MHIYNTVADGHKTTFKEIRKDNNLGMLLTDYNNTLSNFERNFNTLLPAIKDWENNWPKFKDN